jgi:hypothetical protein
MFVIVNNVSATLRNYRVYLLLYGHHINTLGENRLIEEMKAMKPHSNFRVEPSTIHCLNVNNFCLSAGDRRSDRGGTD